MFSSGRSGSAWRIRTRTARVCRPGTAEHPRAPRPYRAGDLPDWTYGDFRQLLGILRQVFRRQFGRELRIGATFDPGPEFAVSSFKYERHPEICRGFCLGGKTFVCCYTKLHADDRAYAAYPGRNSGGPSRSAASSADSAGAI